MRQGEGFFVSSMSPAMFCVKDYSEHSDWTKTRIDSLSFCDSDRNLQQQTSAADWMWKNQRFCIFLILGNVELTWKHQIRTRTIAVDPHSVFADPDPGVFLNADPNLDADPDPAIYKTAVWNFV